MSFRWCFFRGRRQLPPQWGWGQSQYEVAAFLNPSPACHLCPHAALGTVADAHITSKVPDVVVWYQLSLTVVAQADACMW